MIARLLLLLAWGLAISAPVHAQLPELDQPSEEASPEAPAPAQTIATTQDSGADAKIAERIAGIFAELPAFSSVSVAAAQGVVTLSGEVPQQADIARAEAIASRVSGVVTVENRLERDLSISSESGGIATLADRWDGLVKLLPLVALALAVWAGITVIGYLIAGRERLWHRLAPNSFLAELIASAIRFIFAIVGLVVALDMIGASALLGAVLGGAGVVGIALGFAMRDTIENYVASLMLSLRQPFRANDWVVIDDKEGRVIRLTSRATILMTLEGNHLRIPNGQVFRAVILNYTRNPQRRFDFDLGVDADDDADSARRLGRETLAGLTFVLDDPAPEARVIEVGESNVVLRFLGWIDQREADWYKARSSAILAVKAALEDGGFALPEPIYRLRFDARTQPLPLATTREPAASPAAATPPKKAASSNAPADVSPQEEITEMVEAERRLAKGASEKDLLDTSRPVE